MWIEPEPLRCIQAHAYQGADDSTTTACGKKRKEKKKLTAERRTAHEKILYVKRISTGEQCFEDLEKQVMPLSCKNDLP